MSHHQSQEDPAEDRERPSFESWWKRSKDALKKRRITFVQAADQSGEEQDAASAQTPQDKAKARRAQVRKAQIEHRQRKANYVKQLEIDVARIRDLIAATQMETRLLKAENDAMRSRLITEAAPPSQSFPPDQEPAAAGELPQDFDMSFLANVQLDDADGVTVSLGLDDVMNLPVYQISGYASDAYLSSLTGLGDPEPPYCPFAKLSAEQTQQIINFILALEHICWDHFRPSNFQPDLAEPAGTESGHTLMASSLALRTAPEAVFDAMRAQAAPAPLPPSALAAQLAVRAEAGAQSQPPPPPPSISWPASGLTLQSLYGLASSVNAADLDLTPVQAWFELAARYPLDVLLRRDVEDRLKREFVGVVKCPHYGAAIERGAFESICARVLEPGVVAWGA